MQHSREVPASCNATALPHTPDALTHLLHVLVLLPGPPELAHPGCGRGQEGHQPRTVPTATALAPGVPDEAGRLAGCCPGELLRQGLRSRCLGMGVHGLPVIVGYQW